MWKRWLVVTALAAHACTSVPVSAPVEGEGDPRCTVCPSAWGAGVRGCTNLQVDAANCGSCGVACPSGVCALGSCVTPSCDLPCAGTSVCCGTGCTNPNRDVAHCGACGRACLPGELCDFGTCECVAPNTRCPDVCTNLQDDTSNCGACGRVCDAATPFCRGGSCHPCQAGSEQCNGACVDVQNNTANCGACGATCVGPGLNGACSTGTCVTCEQAGQVDCLGVCTSVNVQHESCGACGHSCGRTEQCLGGTCLTGNADCGGACATNTVCCAHSGVPTCVDLAASPQHCGACGIACPMGETCAAGRCVSSGGGGGD